MIRHVVAFKLVSSGTPRGVDDAEEIRRQLLPLVDSVPHVDHLEVGSDLGSVTSHWDLVLVSEHSSEEELDRYQKHPEHLAAVSAIDSLIESRAVVDYTR
jgi:hypothetical protein